MSAFEEFHNYRIRYSPITLSSLRGGWANPAVHETSCRFLPHSLFSKRYTFSFPDQPLFDFSWLALLPCMHHEMRHFGLVISNKRRSNVVDLERRFGVGHLPEEVSRILRKYLGLLLAFACGEQLLRF